MLFAAAAAALLATATPNKAATAPAPAPDKAEKSEAKSKADDFNPAQIMALFEKLFPPQPDPPPERLALSRVAVKNLFPDGTYSRAMDAMMGNIVDRFMSLSDADFGKKDAKGKLADPTTLRQQLIKDDPYFEERMRITQRVLSEEMAKIALLIEPRLREGLARSMARKLEQKQLSDLNAFLATESGQAYGKQSMAMWFDTDVMRAIVASFPDMIVAMPGAMQRLEAETAHLPKPKKAKTEDASEKK